MKKKELKKDKDADKTSMNELLQVFIGVALIEHTKHDHVLNKAARKKFTEDISKTNLYKEVIERATKEN